jgi:hypothetical protein
LHIACALILTPRPAALWVRAGGENPTVGGAPPLRHRVQVETDSFLKVVLLGQVTVHAMIGDRRRQAVTRLTPWLPGTIHAGLFRCRPRHRLVIAWGGLGHRVWEGAPACPLHDCPRGDCQAAFGTGGTAVEEVTQPARLLATLGEEGSILRRDDFRARVAGYRDDPLMDVRPVNAAPELPRHRALTIVARAAQMANVDAASPCEDGSEQRFKELRLGCTDRRHLRSDLFDHCHRPFPG